MTAPLDNIRVLDIGTLLAGPWSTTLLSDFGAEVIKVEQPDIGDALRGSPRDGRPGMPLHWAVEARNKKSITLNLRVEEGQSLLKRLVAQSDVLVENFTPGTLEKWGLGWEALQEVNPALIMVRVSGYGQTGPYSERPGYDRIALGVSGYMYPTGFPDRMPVRPAFPTADYNTATFAAFAAMLALYERDAKGGQGQMIDLALYEAPFRITGSLIAAWEKTGQNRERIGNRNPGFAPAGTFATSDGRYLQIAAGGDGVWQRLARVVGGVELAEDDRYLSSRDRIEAADELEALIAQWVGARTFAEAEAALIDAGVPAGGILRAQDIATDKHFLERESLIHVDDPVHGEIGMPGVIPKLSGTPGSVKWTGPQLGAHNQEIYSGLLGLSHERVAKLAEEGVI